MVKIRIYCVNFNSYDFLENYLKSLDKSCGEADNIAKCDIVVVDNSTQKEAITFKPEYFTLEKFETPKNLGYFPAIAEAMKHFSFLQYDYFILSNVDMTFEGNTIKDIANAKIASDTGWIATKINSVTLGYDLNPQAKSRYSLRKLQILRFAFKHPIIHFIYSLTLHKRKKIRRELPKCEVYAGHGSFIILTKLYFNVCGFIDFPNFLYDEELYLAEKCHQNKLKVIYDPKISVNDIGKASTGKLKAKKYYAYNYQGLDYIIKHFYE